MRMTPVERLTLLYLKQILEVIDPANAAQHDADAQALELGTPRGLAELFELIDLDPPVELASRRPVLRLVTPAD